MASSLAVSGVLLLGSLLLLPGLVSCSYPWPDNVTQHKGYIEVSLLNRIIQNVVYFCHVLAGFNRSVHIVVYLTSRYFNVHSTSSTLTI